MMNNYFIKTKQLLIAALFMVGATTFAQISETGDPLGQPIAAGGATSGAMDPSFATVSQTGIIGTDFEIASVELDVTHTWDGDMDITLVSPGGVTLDLSSGNGGSADNYTMTVFEDGSPSITTGTAPFTGSFQPEGGTFAAAFAGEQINGDWRLDIFDNVGGDGGTLNNFVININSIVTQIQAPDDITVDAAVAACGAVVNYDVFAADDMGNVLPVTVTAGFASGAEFPLGTTMVTVEATDGGGTTVSDSFMVTVNEVTMPVLECQDITVTLDDMGMATITAADLITNGSFEPTALPPVMGDGNPQSIPVTGTGGFPCTGGPTESVANITETGVLGTDYSIDNVEINLTHTWDSDLEITLISPSGTSLDLSSDNGGAGDNYTNTVFQDGAPSITTGSAPFTGTFQPEGGTFAATFDGEDVNGDWTLSICDDAGGDSGTLSSFTITLAENALVVPTGCTSTTSNITLDIMSFDCDDLGDNTVTIIATDAMGNMAMCTPTVSVVPIIDTDGPVDIFTGTGVGDESCATIVTYDEPTSTVTGCSPTLDVQLTAGLASGEAFPVGVTTVEYTTFDDMGNVLSVYSFDVTISDTTSPVLDCPGDLIVGADDDGNYTIEDYTSGITDNCTADADLVSTQEPAAGTVVTEGSVTTITVTSTDEAGNVTECTFDLTVDSTLGTDDVALNNTISLFPNPTNGNITLRNGGNQVLTQVTMIDANGRVVMNRDLSGARTDTQLSISNLASGIYFARISSETATTVKRIVKN